MGGKRKANSRQHNISRSQLSPPVPKPTLKPVVVWSGPDQLLALQRLHGNQFVQRIVANQLQRDEDTAKTLSNPRFANQYHLKRIAAGKGQLSRRHNGRSVEAVQQALHDMAYGLPAYKVDGKFGSETTTAIDRFRSDQTVTEGSGLDKEALFVLDSAAPAPGQTLNKAVDYGRMLADGKLDITIAYGYESDTLMHPFIDAMTSFLVDDEGFSLTENNETTGYHLYTKQTSFKYGKEKKKVSIRVKIIAPKMKQSEDSTDTTDRPETKIAAKEFGKGLRDSDVAMYLGHARYGTGPDFDPKKSAAENFVIGVGSALHEAGVLKGPKPKSRTWYKGHKKMRKVLEQKENDLEALTASDEFDKDKYRVWFFDACTTLHYLDELRNSEIMSGVGRDNLDVLGTRSSIAAPAGSASAIAFIRSILHAKDIHSMSAAMQKEVDDLETKAKADGDNIDLPDDQFFHDGFGDNPVLE